MKLLKLMKQLQINSTKFLLSQIMKLISVIKSSTSTTYKKQHYPDSFHRVRILAT